MTIWQRLRDWATATETAAFAAVQAEARSHVGHVRTVNEDRFMARSDRGIWAVADGMGGQGDGVTAAAIAIGALEDLAESGDPLEDPHVLRSLRQANQRIRGMPGGASGSTIVAGRRDGDEMVVYWAGDSRAYRVSGGKAQLVTNDHSVVQELVDAGVITKAQAREHPQAHIITRALGPHPEVEIETLRVPFRPGDLIVLCSDGLSRSLAAGDLTHHSPSLGHSADRLLRNALRRDGTDNATLVLIQRQA